MLTDEQKKDIIRELDEFARETDTEYGLPVYETRSMKRMMQIIDKVLSGEDEIDQLTEAAAKDRLRCITVELDELDTEDFFGTEGWRHRFGLED